MKQLVSVGPRVRLSMCPEPGGVCTVVWRTQGEPSRVSSREGDRRLWEEEAVHPVFLRLVLIVSGPGPHRVRASQLAGSLLSLVEKRNPGPLETRFRWSKIAVVPALLSFKTGTRSCSCFYTCLQTVTEKVGQVSRSLSGQAQRHVK